MEGTTNLGLHSLPEFKEAPGDETCFYPLREANMLTAILLGEAGHRLPGKRKRAQRKIRPSRWLRSKFGRQLLLRMDLGPNLTGFGLPLSDLSWTLGRFFHGSLSDGSSRVPVRRRRGAPGSNRGPRGRLQRRQSQARPGGSAGAWGLNRDTEDESSAS